MKLHLVSWHPCLRSPHARSPEIYHLIANQASAAIPVLDRVINGEQSRVEQPTIASLPKRHASVERKGAAYRSSPPAVHKITSLNAPIHAVRVDLGYGNEARTCSVDVIVPNAAASVLASTLVHEKARRRSMEGCRVECRTVQSRCVNVYRRSDGVVIQWEVRGTGGERGSRRSGAGGGGGSRRCGYCG
jgi:hypothetical protein